MIKNLDALLKHAAHLGPISVAVAAANDRETLLSIVEAKKKGIIEPLLVGNREWIELCLKDLDENSDSFNIVNESDSAKAASSAVELVSSGKAGILMKGSVPTSKFLNAALSGPNSLQQKSLLSDVVLYEDLRRRGSQLVMISDAGINIAPGIRDKLAIIKNAVSVAHRLGIKRPKVALLSGSERVHPDFQSTIDAVALVKMSQQGDIGKCIIDGPFALDNAIDKDSARSKGIESPVAGRADILIMPSLEAGNIYGKGLQYYAGKLMVHVAVGAKVPILIDSRTASAEAKLHSLALAAIMCVEEDST